MESAQEGTNRPRTQGSRCTGSNGSIEGSSSSSEQRRRQGAELSHFSLPSSCCPTLPMYRCKICVQFSWQFLWPLNLDLYRSRISNPLDLVFVPVLQFDWNFWNFLAKEKTGWKCRFSGWWFSVVLCWRHTSLCLFLVPLNWLYSQSFLENCQNVSNFIGVKC